MIDTVLEVEQEEGDVMLTLKCPERASLRLSPDTALRLAIALADAARKILTGKP